MTLSNDQCIQVVSDVWGMTFAPGTELRDEVLSWQGFGRTLEAMNKLRPYNSEYFTGNYEAFILGRMEKETLWERTHLAALDALEKL